MSSTGFEVISAAEALMVLQAATEVFMLGLDERLTVGVSFGTNLER